MPGYGSHEPTRTSVEVIACKAVVGLRFACARVGRRLIYAGAQAIVRTVGTDISHNPTPDDDKVRTRMSLALAGAEKRLNDTWERTSGNWGDYCVPVGRDNFEYY
jgi:hypothetical protein